MQEEVLTLEGSKQELVVLVELVELVELVVQEPEPVVVEEVVC